MVGTVTPNNSAILCCESQKVLVSKITCTCTFPRPPLYMSMDASMLRAATSGVIVALKYCCAAFTISFFLSIVPIKGYLRFCDMYATFDANALIASIFYFRERKQHAFFAHSFF